MYILINTLHYIKNRVNKTTYINYIVSINKYVKIYFQS